MEITPWEFLNACIGQNYLCLQAWIPAWIQKNCYKETWTTKINHCVLHLFVYVNDTYLSGILFASSIPVEHLMGWGLKILGKFCVREESEPKTPCDIYIYMYIFLYILKKKKISLPPIFHNAPVCAQHKKLHADSDFFWDRSHKDLFVSINSAAFPFPSYC